MVCHCNTVALWRLSGLFPSCDFPGYWALVAFFSLALVSGYARSQASVNTEIRNRPTLDVAGCPVDDLIYLENQPLLARPLGRLGPDIYPNVIGRDIQGGNDEFLTIRLLTLTDGSQRLLAAGYGVNAMRLVDPESTDTGEDFLLARYFLFGVPDQAFGSNGMVIRDFARMPDRIRDILPLNDGTGRFLVVGSGYNAARTGATSTGKDMVLMLFAENGELVTRFGDQGIVSRDFSQGDDEILAVQVIQVNNQWRIRAAGYATNAAGTDTGRDLVLLGYTLEGQPDAACSGDGMNIMDFNQRDDELRSLQLLTLSNNSKRIIAGGYTWTSGRERDLLVQSYNLNCELDNSFGVNGNIIRNIEVLGGNTDSYIGAVAVIKVNNTERILTADYATFRRDTDTVTSTALPISLLTVDYMLLHRYWQNGTQDTSFGEKGNRILSINNQGEDKPAALKMIQTGAGPRILLGKYAQPDCSGDINILQSFNINGADLENGIQAAFNHFGEAHSAVSAMVDFQGADGQHRLVVAGYGFGVTGTDCACMSGKDLVLASFMVTGELDNCFSASETLLRTRPECAGLLPEVIPGVPTIVTSSVAIPVATPAVTPAATPVDGMLETDIRENTSESAAATAALSTLLGLAVVGDIALGTVAGVACYYAVSYKKKLHSHR